MIFKIFLRGARDRLGKNGIVQKDETPMKITNAKPARTTKKRYRFPFFVPAVSICAPVLASNGKLP